MSAVEDWQSALWDVLPDRAQLATPIATLEPRDLTRHVELMRETLRTLVPFAQHDRSCPAGVFMIRPCKCGLGKVLDVIDELLPER